MLLCGGERTPFWAVRPTQQFLTPPNPQRGIKIFNANIINRGGRSPQHGSLKGGSIGERAQNGEEERKTALIIF